MGRQPSIRNRCAVSRLRCTPADFSGEDSIRGRHRLYTSVKGKPPIPFVLLTSSDTEERPELSLKASAISRRTIDPYRSHQTIGEVFDCRRSIARSPYALRSLVTPETAQYSIGLCPRQTQRLHCSSSMSRPKSHDGLIRRILFLSHEDTATSLYDTVLRSFPPESDIDVDLPIVSASDRSRFSIPK
ncbi:hypothetical protein BDN71DRAFT_805114 [Pleurotus eryngii]|uniref:Uncharacterized protein n=1 Tax=Pleurotus eryngii TaxID=5323 RepID=A0A9P6D7K5_PLEER|nr:hypothetical protein BDN71DRAFT_805114 [Pleurotus eryngii]